MSLLKNYSGRDNNRDDVEEAPLSGEEETEKQEVKKTLEDYYATIGVDYNS